MTTKSKCPKWMKRFWADLIQKEFIPIKVLFFIIYGGSMAMFPFLTIHARSLGITERELGIVYAMNPIVAIFGPPLTGMMADRIGNFKIFLFITMAASGSAALTFLAVPAARITHNLPDNLPLTVTCGGLPETAPILLLDPRYKCDYAENATFASITLESCTLCGSNRSLSFVTKEEQEICDQDGPNSPGCLLSEKLSNVSLHMEADLLAKEGDINHLLQARDWTCPNVPLEAIDLAVADTVPYTVATETVQSGTTDCTIKCQATTPRDDLCTNKDTLEVLDPMLTFWCYLLVRLLNSLTLATSFTLFDGAAIAVLKEYKGDYGLQRLYANIGAIIVTPVSGTLIDYFSDLNNIEDYRPAFYLYCGMKSLGAIIILFVDLDFRQPSNRVFKDFRSLMKKPEIVAFLAIVLVTGCCFGLLETFFFWLLQDMGATRFLMGITVTVGGVAGIPTLIASEYIFKRLGLANTIILGMAVYVLRFIGYSFITSPWWSMPFESLECFTVSLMGAACVSYAADLATPATLATLQGTYGGLHYGVGRGLGSLIGGFLLEPIGVRNTFRLAGLFCLISGIVYFVLNRIFFRDLQEERRRIKDEEKKKQKEKNGEVTTVVKEKHNGVIENGEKSSEDISLGNTKSVTTENTKSVTTENTKSVTTDNDNVGFVSDE